MYGPPNVTLMSDADEADGARLKADAAGGVAEDDDGAELAARRAASGSTGGALLRGKRPSSGDGDFLLRMEGSGRTCGARSTANGYMLSNREKRQTNDVSGAWGGRMDTARVSAIAPASLSGPHTTAEPTAVEVEGVNKQALRPIR